MSVPHMIEDVKKTLNDAGLGPGQFSEASICDALRLASIEIAGLLELTPNQVLVDVPSNRQITIPQSVLRILMVC